MDITETRDLCLHHIDKWFLACGSRPQWGHISDLRPSRSRWNMAPSCICVLLKTFYLTPVHSRVLLLFILHSQCLSTSSLRPPHVVQSSLQSLGSWGMTLNSGSNCFHLPRAGIQTCSITLSCMIEFTSVKFTGFSCVYRKPHTVSSIKTYHRNKISKLIASILRKTLLDYILILN